MIARVDLGQLETHVAELQRERAELSGDDEKTEYLDVLIGAYLPLLERMRGRRSGPVTVDGSGRRRLSSAAMRLQKTLTGCRSVTVTVAQLFRMSDLLIEPQRVQAVEFHETIHTVARLRNSLQKGTSIQLGDVGTLRPVATFHDQFHRFWVAGIPDLREFERSGEPPLTLVPFELSPLPRLAGMRADADVWLRDLIQKSIDPINPSMKISSVHGRLRLYATGVGVIRLTLLLEFRESAEVEVLAALARKIESLLFIDAEGASTECESFLADVVDAVACGLFSDPGGHDRRWRPPDTIFRFHQGSFTPETHLRELAYLMSLSPGNYQGVQGLERQVAAHLRTPFWRQDGVLTLASQRVVLFLKKAGDTSRSRQRQRLLTDAVETHELVNAALYTRRLFAEDFAKFRRGGELAEATPGTGSFERLERLLDTTRRAMRAVGWVQEHLQATAEWPLIRFGRALWQTNSEDASALSWELSRVAEWIRDSGYAAHPAMSSLMDKVNRITSIAPPFSENRPLDPTPGSDYQEELENEILDGLERLETLLNSDHVTLAEIDAEVYAVERARNALLAS
ncbi:MAG TPA: hypothetical protein VE974_19260 [Thermoanaerobaculia bacterium]|nr:hypothetical protein [Thermoanaerobaculia bacterium]